MHPSMTPPQASPIPLSSPHTHVPRPSPSTRLDQSTQHPHGVLTGGILLDMLSALSASSRPDDWDLALWLRTQYVAPFGRVDRLDGLVVAHPAHIAVLLRAWARWVDLEGPRAAAVRLWVPGREPLAPRTGSRSRSSSGAPITPSTASWKPSVVLPEATRQEIWIPAEAFSRHGVLVARRGRDLGLWVDALGWERRIWMATVTATATAAAATATVEEAPREEGKTGTGTDLAGCGDGDGEAACEDGVSSGGMV